MRRPKPSFSEDGPDVVFLQVGPPPGTKTKDSEISSKRGQETEFSNALTENEILHVITGALGHMSLMKADLEGNHDIEQNTGAAEIEDYDINITAENIDDMFSDEEKRKINKTGSSSSLVESMDGILAIRLKDEEQDLFKDFVQVFGPASIRSWPKVAPYLPFINHLDTTHSVPLPTSDNMEEVEKQLSHVKATGGFLARACRENWDSEYAFCCWMLFNELNELLPNIGWGARPPQPPDPSYRIADIPGQGRGAIATRRIETGETVFVDRALTIQPTFMPLARENHEPYFTDMLSVLSPEDRDTFYSLSDAGKPGPEDERVVRILETNNIHVMFPQSKHAPHYAAIFPLLSRMNHSCSPNATNGFDPKSLTVEIRALCPIEPGEQIMLNYCDLMLPAEDRKAELSRRYLFECKCEKCTLSPAEQKKSDDRRKRIDTFDEHLAMKLYESAINQNFFGGSNTRTVKGKGKETIVDGVDQTRADLSYWDESKYEAARQGLERVIKMHNVILDDIETEKLYEHRFEHIRWIVRAYATLGDMENTKKWVEEGRKALRISIDNKTAYRDSEQGVAEIWQKVTNDVTLHPDWDYLDNRMRYTKGQQ